MADHGVDAEVQRVWIEHAQALRSQVTSDKGSECKDTSVGAKLAVAPPVQDPETRIKLGRK